MLKSGLLASVFALGCAAGYAALATRNAPAPRRNPVKTLHAAAAGDAVPARRSDPRAGA